ncbi:MAG: hypothetical protein ACRDWI_02365 [Jiangellaceae bacterium]
MNSGIRGDSASTTMLGPLGRTLSPAGSVDEEPLGALRSARADVEAVLDDAGLATAECDPPAGRRTVEQHLGRDPG